MDLSFRKIASNLSLSVGTVHNVWKWYEVSGEVAATKQPARHESRMLGQQHKLLVVGLVMEDPALYLKEVCGKVLEITGLQVSAPYVELYTDMGLHEGRSANLTSKMCTISWDYMADVHMYDTSQFVWIDETGCNNKDHIRKFGYALKGECLVCHRILHRGQRVSAIAAMDCSGILAVDLKKGSVGGDEFYDFVRGSLITEMVPFDGQSPRSIA